MYWWRLPSGKAKATPNRPEWGIWMGSKEGRGRGKGNPRADGKQLVANETWPMRAVGLCLAQSRLANKLRKRRIRFSSVPFGSIFISSQWFLADWSSMKGNNQIAHYNECPSVRVRISNESFLRRNRFTGKKNKPTESKSKSEEIGFST